MHIEHIWPRSKGGTVTLDNLCYACAWCNSYKGTQTHAFDPETQEEVRLFHPRTDVWSSHFAWGEAGLRILGINAIGNATVEALHMNNEYVLPARRHWILAGWHPPQLD